jgi:hypothetical protein
MLAGIVILAQGEFDYWLGTGNSLAFFYSVGKGGDHFKDSKNGVFFFLFLFHLKGEFETIYCMNVALLCETDTQNF